MLQDLAVAALCGIGIATVLRWIFVWVTHPREAVDVANIIGDRIARTLREVLAEDRPLSAQETVQAILPQLRQLIRGDGDPGSKP